MIAHAARLAAADTGAADKVVPAITTPSPRSPDRGSVRGATAAGQGGHFNPVALDVASSASVRSVRSTPAAGGNTAAARQPFRRGDRRRQHRSRAAGGHGDPATLLGALKVGISSEWGDDAGGEPKRSATTAVASTTTKSPRPSFPVNNHLLFEKRPARGEGRSSPNTRKLGELFARWLTRSRPPTRCPGSWRAARR